MAIKTIMTCPLGSDCERIEGDSILRCAWFVTLKGEDPQTGDEIDTSKCAIAWEPILLIEGNGKASGIASSVQSLRNETIIRQEAAIKAISNAENIKP